MTALAGTCHCGAVTAVLETADPATLQVRACQCGFCRRHGAKTVGDPSARLTLAFADRSVRRYRFGLKTADFLICVSCGDYVAAVMDDLAVLNVVAVDIAPLATRTPEPVDYGPESAAERVARRRARWMPVVLELAA
jgi:hypothetical protein